MEHLNRVEGTEYVHQACLDRLIRDRPQPEALYEDPRTGAALVVERKSVVWPRDYAERHARDHLVVDRLWSELPRRVADGHYVLHLEYLFKGVSADVSEYVEEVTQGVKQGLKRVECGATIGSSREGRSWSFREQHPSEHGDWGRAEGVVVLFDLRGQRLAGRTAIDPSAHVQPELVRTLASAGAKMRDYTTASRVLLLHGHGDLEHMPADWWNDNLAMAGVPDEIDQVWTGEYEYFDDGQEDWFYDRVWPEVLPALTDV